MNRIVLTIGALVALLSFSATQISSPIPQPSYSYTTTSSAQGPVNWYDGYIRVGDDKDCVPKGKVRPDPPLPKNVPNATWYNGGFPPAKYRKDTRVTIYFENPSKITRDAQNNRPTCGTTFFAYTYSDKREIHLPNPCLYPQTDPYARLACHELGHVNGWPGYHGDL